MDAKDEGTLHPFRAFFEREHATTAKVLRAFPPDQAGFKPSERSNTAQSLAWTFVSEERMILRALQGLEVLGSGVGMNPPDSWDAILDEFDAAGAAIRSALAGATEETLRGKVAFYTGPKQMGEYSTGDFVRFMMLDQIHHRGQLSVYLRAVGAKVPSIYGPSADEPWN